MHCIAGGWVHNGIGLKGIPRGSSGTAKWGVHCLARGVGQNFYLARYDNNFSMLGEGHLKKNDPGVTFGLRSSCTSFIRNMSRADLKFGASSAQAQQDRGWLERFTSKKRASLVVDLACCSAIFSVSYWFLSCRKRNVIPCIRPLDLHVGNHHEDPWNEH